MKPNNKFSEDSHTTVENFFALRAAIAGMSGRLVRGLKFGVSDYGITNHITEGATTMGFERKVADNKGNKIVRMFSINGSGSALHTFLELPVLTISSFDVPNFKITISEHRMGVVGALSEITFTPKGKQVHERGEKMSLPILEPITKGDIQNVLDKIEQAIREEVTPRISSRIPLQSGTLIGERTLDRPSIFEKIVRSSIKQTTPKKKNVLKTEPRNFPR